MKLTKRGKIIIAIVIVLLSVALGYLIWRVNQQSNLSPTDSNAGGTGEPGDQYCCRFKCCDGTWIARNCNTTGTYDGICNGVDMSSLCANNGGYGSCSSETPIVKCSCQSWSDGCGTNCTFPSGTQSEVDSRAASSCTSIVAMCNVSTGETYYEEYKSGQACYGKLDQCKNPHADNPCVTETNVCDGGSWNSKPSGNIDFGSTISYSAKANDSDGIDTATIVVTLKNTSTGTTTNLTKCGASINTTCYQISTVESGEKIVNITGTLSNTTSQLTPSSYQLNMSWKDKKGASSTNCALSTTFTALEKETNPDWDITKTAAEECIDENTPSPKSQITYLITVKNTGDGEGKIDKIIDTLDSKVQDNFVRKNSIDGFGEYADGKITWDFTSNPVTIAAGASKTYTYSLMISDSQYFDTYSNEVTLYPEGSDSISANASITADCVVTPDEEPDQPDVPETGIFDTALSKIATGVIVLIVGIFVYNIPNATLSISIRNGKMYIINERRKRFEKKVEKR